MKDPNKLASIPVPSKKSGYRMYYENAQNPGQALAVSLSAMFSDARRELDGFAIRNMFGSANRVMSRGAHRAETLTDVATRADDVIQTIEETTCQDKARVRLQKLFAPQLLFMPVLFKYPAFDPVAAKHRAELMDGTYGEIVNYASELKDELHTFSKKSSERKSIIGAMGELAALGIGNRPQTHKSCYLPSLYQSDMKGVDLDFLGYRDAEPVARYTGIQIKSYWTGPETYNSQPGRCLLDSNTLGLAKHCFPFYLKNNYHSSIKAMELEVDGEGDLPLGPQAIKPSG
ncbi:MAG TPA: hypothetical protein VJR27_03610 [Candidatus Saccharimonadales bacterium]|nr:hypothetical protein [Candidatus Saccharimonadales bacterium]